MNEKHEPPAPSAESQRENRSAGDDAMQDDLTEERDVRPEKRADVAAEQHMDP